MLVGPVRVRQVDAAAHGGRAGGGDQPAQIAIGGRDVTDLAPKDRDIAMVFQSYALYPNRTVRGNRRDGVPHRGLCNVTSHRTAAITGKMDHATSTRNSATPGTCPT